MNIIETAWKWTSGLSKRKSTNLIVLHHAAAVTCTAAQVDSWHKVDNGWSGIGYHFFISKGGTIYRGRPEWAVGAHASGRNSDSIGICVEGNYETETTMPKAQRAAVREVLRHLKATYPNAVIKGHKEVGATGCPGKYYPLNEMKNYFNNAESETFEIEEYTDINAIVWELNHRGIVEDSDGMVAEMTSKPNGRLYWLGRKICHAVRKLNGKAETVNVKEYEGADEIVWDLHYRGIVEDRSGLIDEITAKPNGRLYWLARKGLHYLRCRD